MVEPSSSAFESKLVIKNGDSFQSQQIDPYADNEVDFVTKPRTLYSSNALRQVANVKDLSKKRESMTMQNIQVRQGVGGLKQSKSKLFSSIERMQSD